MIDEAIARYPWLWTLAWQSTACLAAGLTGSYLLRRQAVRAHQVLLLSLIAAVLVPAISQVVKRNGWGLLEAERAVPGQEAPLAEPQSQVVMTPRVTTNTAVSLRPAVDTAGVSAPSKERFDWAKIIVPLWLAASAALLLRLANQLVLGRHIVRCSETVVAPHITTLIETAREELAIQANVVVRMGDNVRSPVIWCWAPRPILLIPASSYGDDDGLDWASVIRHELAHWKRRDHLNGLLAELMACIMPWQPLTWWTRKRLVALSEEACDDWVIASGQGATRYARTLLGLLPQNQNALIPSVVPSRKGLSGRIHRILHDACGNPSLGPRWAVASVATAVCVILGVALAQTRPASNESQPQTDTMTATSEEFAVPEGKITLRLIDANGQPVLGAKAGAHAQIGPSSILGEEMRWPSAGVSDREGVIALDAKDVFFPSQRDRSALYILHNRRGIGAIQEVTREDIAKGSITVVLKPVCRVHGTLDSTGLASMGMPLRGTGLNISSNNYTLVICSWIGRDHDFDFPLPPGTYKFYAHGAGGQAEDVPRISADTEHKIFEVTIRQGQKDLDLNVIDLAPTKLATLIGGPAPEIGPMKGWKHGPGVSLAQLKGQVVWLHFGGEYPSVSRDLPRLADLHDAFAGKGLTIVAIYNCNSLDQLEQRWAEANERFGGVRDAPFRIAIDGDKTTCEKYGAPTYPRNVLIDPAGTVVGQPNLFYAKEIVSQMLDAREDAMLLNWQRRFNEVYRLADNEVLKRIAPPFIAERMEYYINEHGYQAELIPRGPDVMTFYWDGQLKNWGMTFGRSNTLGQTLNGVLGLKSYEYDGPKSLLDIELPGDWIIRNEASQEVKLRALEQLVAREIGRKIHFEKQSVQREALIVTGRFNFHPPVGTYEDTSVHLYATKTDPDEGAGGGTAQSLDKFLQMLGDRVNMPVIDQTESGEQIHIPYRHHRSSHIGRIQDPQERAKELRVLLDHVTEQTELHFEIRMEPVEVWSLTEPTDG